jgi:uncharacterized protein YfiM (DUF2279 family)
MDNSDMWKMHETRELVFALFIGGVAGVAIGLWCAENNAHEVRKEAVLVGAAQYISNEKGISRFEWIKKYGQ